MQPVSVFNGILARVSLYIDGHVVFVPMEEQRNNASQMESIELYILKGQMLGV